ncbi:reverse transcriptase zinc-binding domain-containing protein, partial [Tanacetum coccineum]
ASLLSSSGNGSFKALISSSSYLQKASREGKQKIAKDILDKRKELVRFSITKNRETVFQLEASRRETEFVKNLQILMEKKDIELQDNSSYVKYGVQGAIECGDFEEWFNYSNRVAARISPGRMKEALGDCITAKNIDPDFLKAKFEATFFYLAMGEIENSKKWHPMCLQSGIDNCVDRKLIAHGSEGPEKALTQESLVSEGATLEACLVTEGASLEACLVTEGIAMDDNLVVKESTYNSVTLSEQLDKSSSSRNGCSRSRNETRSFDNESSSLGNDAYADIRPSYDNDTVSEPESIPDTYVVNENNSNIISDIPNMDPDRDKEERDYVDYEQHHAFFTSLINNLKCDVEKCTEVNREAQQVNALLTNELERYKEK